MPDNDPVIFDDGGSTRIKQLKANVNMDGLLNNPHSDKAAGAFGAPGAVVCTMKIRFHHTDGAQGPIVNQALTAGDTVEIVSEDQQRVTLTFDNTDARLQIVLDCLAAGVDTLVDAKNHKGFRLYEVVNAGPIQTVSFNGQTLFDVTVTPSVYTMVHLS